MTLHGHQLSRTHTGLSGNHLMEFASDLSHHRIYPIGPCYYTGGLAAINLDSGKHRLLAPTKSGGPTDLVCGDHAVTVPGKHLLAIAHIEKPNGTGKNSVQFVSTRTGDIKQTTSVHKKPADLLALRITSPRTSS